MLTHTTQLALRALLVLGLEQEHEPVTPRALAERLDCSPTYLGKTLGLLTKAGILRSVRGAHGGVVLAQAPSMLTLLAIVEACQGLLTAPYCKTNAEHDRVCSYHQAMAEVHEVTVSALSRWTLSAMLASPARPAKDNRGCRMAFKGCEVHCAESDARRR